MLDLESGPISVAKTKALISFTVTVKLICAFVFAFAKCWFSHDAAHILFWVPWHSGNFENGPRRAI